MLIKSCDQIGCILSFVTTSVTKLFFVAVLSQNAQ